MPYNHQFALQKTTDNNLYDLYRDLVDKRHIMKQFYQEQRNIAIETEIAKSNTELWNIQIQKNWLPDTSTPKPSIPESMNFVRDIARHTKTDELVVFLAILGITSISLRGRYRVRVTREWSEPMVDYLLFIGESGTRKSQLVEILKTPIEHFVNSPPKQYNKEPCDIQNVTKQNFAVTRHINKVMSKELANVPLDYSEEAASMLTTITQRAATFEKAHCKEIPAQPRILFDSGSLGKLPSIMAQHGGCISVLDAEGGFFAAHKFNKNSDINLLLKAHSMESYDVDPHNKRPLQIRNTAMPMVIFCQPNTLHKLLNNKEAADRGLISRFLPALCCEWQGQKTLGYFLDGAKPSIDKYTDRIVELLNKNYTQCKNREIYEIQASDKARDIFMNFEKENSAYSNTTSCHICLSFLRKLHGLAVRIAGDIHAWEHKDACAIQISENSAETAIRIARHIRTEAMHIYNKEHQQCIHFASKILKWIQGWDVKGPYPHFTSRKAQQSVAGLNKSTAPGALNLLCSTGYLKEVTTPDTSPIYVVNPQLWTLD